MKKALRILSIVLVMLFVLMGLVACAHNDASDHAAVGDWCSDATHHWHVCKNEKCADAGDRAEHVYVNACDTTCDVCGYTRTVGAHVYDNACDTSCNVCGVTRAITHDHADTLTAGDTTHWYACSVCGDKKDEAAHVFDKTVASNEYLKAEATATTKAQYYKSCVCGKASATEYFETDKTAGTLADIQDLSKTYDKVELANPTYETNSDGAVTIEWYQGDTKLDAKPVNAGTYKVKVIIAESATYTGVSAEKEFTIAKKTLNYLELTKVYDGKGFISYALGTEHGVVSGDVVVLTCDEEFDYDAGSYYFIDKTDDISITDAGIDRAFLDGADAGNYQFANQAISGLDEYEMGGMLTVTKRPVWAENVEFTYDGHDIFCGDEYPIFTLQNLVSGETIDLGDVNWCFDSKNVGATLTAVELSEEYNPNYMIDLSKCSASIVPKVISDLEAEFVYNSYHAFHSEPLGVENGIISNDLPHGIFVTVEFNGVNVGSTVKKAYLNVDPGADTTILDNYTLDLSTCSASIVPKVISGLEAEFVYNNYHAFHSEPLSVENGIMSNDLHHGIYVTVEFDGVDVGSTVNKAYLNVDPGVDTTILDNYTLDLSTCSASIVPKVIDNLTYEFVYNGEEYQSVTFEANDIPGIIGNDSLFLEVYFATPDVGAELETGGEFGFEPGFNETNYVLGENYSFSIVPKKLTLKTGEKIEVTKTYSTLNQHMISVSSDMFDGYVDTEAATLWLTATLPSKNAGEYTDGVILTPYVGNTAVVGTVSHNYDFSEVEATFTINPLTVSLSSYVKVEYNGTCEFTLDTPFDLTSENTGGGQDSVSDRDEVYITWIETSSADITDETFAIDYTLGGVDACNYEIDELGVEITKKKLTNLHLYITSDTYESGEITLLEKDGVVKGEVVKISITDVNDQDFWEGFSIFMELADGTSPDADRYETIALVESGDYANYELATYDDGSGNQVVGIVEGVASCDVQFDGSCNCGTSHLIGTAASSDIRTTLPCATTWTGGVYKISTLPGYWSILPSDNFADITAIYDSNGNEVEIDANDAGFYAEAGTYYVHIGKASDLGTAQDIMFTYTNTLANIEDDVAKSELITARSGDKIFFRIENDAPWGASMNVYSDNETTILDPSKYTVKVYDENFNELTDVIYDGTDVYHTTDDNYTVVGKTLYIEVLLSSDTNVQLYIY